MKLLLRSLVYGLWFAAAVIVAFAGLAAILNPQLGREAPTVGIILLLVGVAAAVVFAWAWWEEAWKRRD